jgi:hypothetical protein
MKDTAKEEILRMKAKISELANQKNYLQFLLQEARKEAEANKVDRKVLEKALLVNARLRLSLHYYATDPAYEESPWGISSNFRSNNSAKAALEFDEGGDELVKAIEEAIYTLDRIRSVRQFVDGALQRLKKAMRIQQ